MELKIEEVKTPELKFNYEELKAELKAKTADYKVMVYTDDQIKEAKSDRAKLNGLKKALNDERIRREREYMEPFNVFKGQINEIIGIIDEPIQIIDAQVKEYDQKKKDQKLDEIIDLWNDKEKPEWLQFEQVFNKTWLNASTSMKKVAEDIDLKITQVKTDLQAIEALPEFSFEALETYKTGLNLSAAIAEGQRLADIQKRKEEQERLREEAEERARIEAEQRAAAEEARRQAELEEQENQPEPEPVAEAEAPAAEVNSQPNPEPEQPQWVRFQALLTRAQALELKEFFDNRNIEFKPV